MGQPTDERTNAILSVRAGRRRFVGAGLVTLVALAGGGVGLKWLLDSGDGGESASGGLVNLAQLTATPTTPAPATLTSTPEAAAGQAVQGTHVAENGCPGVTLDYIAQTGQADKLTAPFSSCVDAEWFAVPLQKSGDSNRDLMIGRIAYTIPVGTGILSPIDGRASMGPTDNGALGRGGYMCIIEHNEYQLALLLFNAEFDVNKNAADLSRGEIIGASGTVLPPQFGLGKSNLVLSYGPRLGTVGASANPDYWVDGHVATAFLAV